MQPSLDHLSVSVVYDHASWQDFPLCSPAACLNIIARAFDMMGPDSYKRRYHVDIQLTDDVAMRAMNLLHRSVDKATNVLSFPLYTRQELCSLSCPETLLGDIVLSWSTLQKEASEKNLSMIGYATHLLLHGFFHLMGYDHETDDEEKEMCALEDKTLKALGWSLDSKENILCCEK